ncbi:MAG: hypothetical protein HY690_15015 [Chloroflexi bacterium]|nr:hypothetical protein [Chloroflexota bacterium]
MPQPRQSRIQNPKAKSVLAVALLLVLALLSHPGQVAARSLLLLPDLFPDSPVRPLAWLTPSPERETLRYGYSAGQVEADVYHPAAGGRHGAAILELGARPVPKRDPLLVRFADGLARAGSVVMIPESDNLVAGRVLPQERDALVLAFQRLRAMADVDPERVGFIGFSVGGGLSTLAAADPRIRDQVAFVNTVGAYFDARRLLEEIATRSLVVDGERQAWEPSPVTLQVFGLQLIEALDQPSDRELLSALLFQGQQAPDAPERLTPQGQAVLRLLRGVDRAEIGAALAQLPPEALARLDAISPARDLAAVRARLYVMHDLGDGYIPFTQSRHLVRGLEPPSLRWYTEFNIFQHVIPDKPVDPLTFTLDLARLYRHLFTVSLEFL